MSLANLEIDYSGLDISGIDQQPSEITGSQRLANFFRRGLAIAGRNALQITETVGEQAWGLTRKLGRMALKHRVGLTGLATAITGATAVGLAIKSSLDINLYSTYRELFGVMSNRTPDNDVGLEMTVGSVSAATSAVLGMGHLTLSRLRDIGHQPSHTTDAGGIDTLYAIMDDQRDDDFSNRW